MTEESQSSPAWGSNTKLVVALTLVVVVGALLVKFQFILSPLLISLLLAYLLHPLASFIQHKLRCAWGMAVAIIYLVLIAVSVGLLVWGGFALIQQGVSLITTVQDGLTALPQIIQDYSSKSYHFGPFNVDFAKFDLNDVSKRVLDMIQPLLSETGTLVGSLAGSAADFIGLTMFVIFVSYFVVAESGGGLRKEIIKINLPGYNQDIERLSHELSRIWNAFMRGQIIIFFIALGIYFIVLSLLGVHYALSLALLAGLARFLPYFGPTVNWIVLLLVAYFQEHTNFGLEPLVYALLVFGIAFLIDFLLDYMVIPQIFSDTLAVHPAAVLVAAIVAASLFGILGVVVAAPILATATLFWKYVTRKLLDIDPWLPEESRPAPTPLSESIRGFFSKFNLNSGKRK